MREVGAEDGSLGIAAAELHLDLDGAAVWWVVGVHFLAILRADHLPDINAAWVSTAETARAGMAQHSRRVALQP